MPRATRRACTIALPFTRTQLLERGFTIAELRGWLARGEVVSWSHGVFAPSAISDHQVLRDIYASAAVVNGVHAVPIAGAAAVHELWTPPSPHPSWTAINPRRSVPAQCVTTIRGLRMPNAAWTALQLARWQALPGALVALDSALAHGVGLRELLALADVVDHWPGNGNLRRALEVTDPKSESPLESWSRGLMIEADLPAPELQRVITIDGLKMRVDFCWPDARVIGEADGAGKYASDPGRAIADEKRRQSRLQSAGWLLYRWTWQDVHPQHAAWLRGLRHALAR